MMDYIDETQEMEQMGTERLVSEGFSLEMARIQTKRRVSLNSEPVTVEQVKAEMGQTRMRCTPCEVKHEKHNPVNHPGDIT